MTDNQQQSEQKKPCTNCGAELTYKPSSTLLSCGYCGHEEAIEKPHSELEELELSSYLERLGTEIHTQDITMLTCKSCGANQHIEEKYKSLHCVYCSQPLIVEDTYKEDWITPGAVLPFQLTQQQSYKIFKTWVKGLWFAPNKLKRAALKPENVKGLYLPYWTFDAQLFAKYKGERGDYYYTTELYTTTVNGKTVTKTRQVQKTRWTSTSGNINSFVDDTLIAAMIATKIPKDITQWNLDKLEVFNSKYLSGFVTEKYTMSLEDGHQNSIKEANKIAHYLSKQDIGGDVQRIHNLDMSLTEEKFKHILLPVYISSYLFNNKTYHFYVNGETGKLSGDRPYSFCKIFFAIFFMLLVIGIIVVGALYL